MVQLSLADGMVDHSRPCPLTVFLQALPVGQAIWPIEFNSGSRRKLAVHDIGDDSNAFVAVIDVFPCGRFLEPPGNTLVDEGRLVAFER